MQGAAATVGAAWPGRFVLGVGVSHGSQVDPSGQVYEKPLQRMASTRGDGCSIGDPVPGVPAAVRPTMLELACDCADGAHTYSFPPNTPHSPAKRSDPTSCSSGVRGGESSDASEARRVARDHSALKCVRSIDVVHASHQAFPDRRSSRRSEMLSTA
jgi:hypothetical protein